jgi:hypothetical protein
MGTVRRRRYVRPHEGDTLATIAEREVPELDGGAQTLLSWNLHLAMRPFPVGAPGQVLVTDIVYVEPPTVA